MIRISTNDVARLLECRADLERVLFSLDRIGAGIAAIHVNAAIEHLIGNIDLAEDTSTDCAWPSQTFKTSELRH